MLDFTDRYRIVSLTGRVYSRTMLLSAAMRGCLARTLKVTRAQVGAVLDDDAWLRPYGGMIPTYVAREAVLEAFTRAQL